MWKFNPFMPKEQPTSLEGRAVDVGNIKLYVQKAIAEGGFSCVYLARDSSHASKHYALKHIICNGEESLDLVMKEISVMKVLQDHPNVVNLVAHTILDIGRTKEALLVMELCEKSLVSVLENRGAGYFDEKHILLIFRDVCNAVFAMHSQSPPIAHRDLKAENILLGHNGAWKLCDFGSTSTNHKCFDRPEDMGIEEDNIRKHTTPSYRAPEMWDLYRKEVISEKVDIWALGCLLYRICYLKLAFDGESKLQILNGNYRIPELPKYSALVTGLIRDMLGPSPDSRPDITQVWFRVNGQLPVELQKHLPDGPASAIQGHPRSNLMPQRAPPPQPSSREQTQYISPQPHDTRKASGGGGASIGAFWSTHHTQDNSTNLSNRERPQNNSLNIPIEPQDTFVADFDTSKQQKSVNANSIRLGKEEAEAEVTRLKEQLKQTNLEKAEITSKYEKLTAICRSQRQEIQELKKALASAAPSPQTSKNDSKSQISPGGSQFVTPQREKTKGSIWELEQGMFVNNTPSPSSMSQSWQAFGEEPKPQIMPQSSHLGTARPINGHQNTTTKPSTASFADNFWSVGQDVGSLFTTPNSQGSTSQRFGNAEVKKIETKQPSGWAGF